MVCQVLVASVVDIGRCMVLSLDFCRDNLMSGDPSWYCSSNCVRANVPETLQKQLMRSFSFMLC